MADETPKIIVDSDWKSQAQAEKERLAAAEKKKPAPAAPTAGSAGAAPGQGAPAGGPRSAQDDQEAMPPADFTTLVGTLVTQALLYLGGFPDPQTGRAVVSLEHARFNIDLLGVLEEKTKNNLTPEEAQDLSQSLNELRLRYVEVARIVADMVKQGRVSGAPGGGMGGAMGGMAGGMPGISGPGVGPAGGPGLRMT